MKVREQGFCFFKVSINIFQLDVPTEILLTIVLQAEQVLEETALFTITGNTCMVGKLTPPLDLAGIAANTKEIMVLSFQLLFPL